MQHILCAKEPWFGNNSKKGISICQAEHSKILRKDNRKISSGTFFDKEALYWLEPTCTVLLQTKRGKASGGSLGEQPQTVAPTPVGLGVSAPRTRLKLLKTTNCHMQKLEEWQRSADETSIISDPTSVGLRVLAQEPVL